MNRDFNNKSLTKVDTTRAIRSTPQAALKVIPNLLPLNLFKKRFEAKRALRLRNIPGYPRQ